MSISIFMQHPVRAAMLDPKFPPYDPEVYAKPYIELEMSGKKPTDAQVEAVRTGLLEFCKSVDTKEQFRKDKEGIDKTWAEMKPRFEQSMGLTQLMLDFGCKSRYFYSYLFFTGRKLFFVALEMKDGYMIPVSFEMKFERIPETDWAFIVAHQEPSHSARGETDGIVQGLLRKARRIYEGGAGTLPGYRYYGYPLGQNGQKIFACDSDPRVLEYLPLLFDRALSEYGIEYQIGDVLKNMDESRHLGQYDVVRFTGLLSYFPKAEDKSEVIWRAKRLLADDGNVIVCDLQTMGGNPLKSSLVRSAKTGLWPMDPNDPHKLTPSASVEAAVQEIEDICSENKLEMVYLPDFCNGNPLCRSQAAASPKCVMFLLGKHVSKDMFDDVPELGVYAKQ